MAADILSAATDYEFPRALCGFDFLHGQSYAALTIDCKHLHLNNVALGQLVADLFNALVGDL